MTLTGIREERSFKIDVNAMIYLTVMSQTGSFAKALMELIMNSIDAGATRIDVNLNKQTYEVIDDGRGMQTEEEVSNFFETFAFSHDAPEGKRTFGRFGIGRGQQWRWADSTYRTGPFSLEVLIDHTTKRLSYVLVREQAAIEGTVVLGTFKTPLKPSEYSEVITTFEELVRFSSVPIFLNGRQINLAPDTQKWTHDTPEAWIRVTESGKMLIYNMGMLVGQFSAAYGRGSAIVVTKPGYAIELNMSRNDVMQGDPVWNRIRNKVEEISVERIRTSTRHTEADLQMLGRSIANGTADPALVFTVKLVTDTLNRSMTLKGMHDHLKKSGALMMHDSSSRHGNRVAHEQYAATVLHPRTLERFGVNTLDEFKDLLINYVNLMKQRPSRTHMPYLTDFQFSLVNAKTYTSIKEAGLTSLENLEIKQKLKDKEQMLVSALYIGSSSYMSGLYEMFYKHGIRTGSHDITLLVGRAEQPRCWASRSEGVITVVIEERRAAHALKGGNELMQVITEIGVRVLESMMDLPEVSDSGLGFNDLVLDYIERHARFGRTYSSALRKILILSQTKNIPLPKTMLVVLDSLHASDGAAQTAAGAADPDVLPAPTQP